MPKKTSGFSLPGLNPVFRLNFELFSLFDNNATRIIERLLEIERAKVLNTAIEVSNLELRKESKKGPTTGWLAYLTISPGASVQLVI